MEHSLLDQLADGVRRKPAILAALLAIATVLLYASVAHHEFLDMDDYQYVTNNVHVNTGLRQDNLVWAFSSFFQGNWDPVTWISHMVDCQIFGLRSGPHHLVNGFLHAINVVLLFLLLRKATGAVWRGFLVAALFAVHPLNVETVAWVAERKSLLSALFSLLTIAAYGGYLRRPSWRKYLLLMATFALALMSKPMAVTLPLVLLLLDYWPLSRIEDASNLRKWVELAVEKVPLLFMSAASSYITVAAERAGNALAKTSALGMSPRIENAAISCVKYIGKLFWPGKLAVVYPYSSHLPLSEAIASGVLLVAITLAVIYFRSERFIFMGWFLFIGTLIPVIGIVQFGVQSMADRFSYIPFIGLFIILSWGLNDLASVGAPARLASIGIAVCLIMTFATMTTRYLQYWQNGVALFTHARDVAVVPDRPIEMFLADSLFSAGQIDRAYQHYEEACALDPRLDICHYNMAQILLSRHQLQEALEQYKLTVRCTSSKEIAVTSLIKSGQIMLDFGDYRKAENLLTGALQIDPANQDANQLFQSAIRQRSNSNR